MIRYYVRIGAYIAGMAYADIDDIDIKNH